MKELTKNKTQEEMLGQQSEIDALFMIDRQVDLVTPFCYA